MESGNDLRRYPTCFGKQARVSGWVRGDEGRGSYLPATIQLAPICSLYRIHIENTQNTHRHTHTPTCPRLSSWHPLRHRCRCCQGRCLPVCPHERGCVCVCVCVCVSWRGRAFAWVRRMPAYGRAGETGQGGEGEVMEGRKGVRDAYRHRLQCPAQGTCREAP